MNLRIECIVNSSLSSVCTCQTEPDVGQTSASVQSIKGIATYARALPDLSKTSKSRNLRFFPFTKLRGSTKPEKSSREK